jgi:hypothetical protein
LAGGSWRERPFSYCSYDPQGTHRTARPAPNALQENTPAVLRLYTQDLKSFVSRKEKEFSAPPGGHYGRPALRASCETLGKTPQNAGCTMAIHANCTKLEILKFYN